MIHYSCLWSTSLEDLTVAELAWLRVYIEHAGLCQACARIDCLPNLAVHEDTCPECGAEYVLPHTPMGDEWPGFDYRFLDTEATLNMSSDDGYSADAAATMIERFLDEFRPRDRHHIDFAFTSAPARPDGFGGGRVLIAAWGQAWTDHEHLEAKIEALRPTLRVMEESRS